MIDWLIWLGSPLLALAAGIAIGWHLGRSREMKRVSLRVSIVLGQVERRHKKDLDRLHASFAKQSRELKEARVKQRLREAADKLVQAHERSTGRRPTATRSKAMERAFATTRPMRYSSN